MKNSLIGFSIISLLVFVSCSGNSSAPEGSAGPEVGKAYKLKIASDALPYDASQALKDIFTSAVTASFSASTVNLGLANN